jgi:hypothetical protein
MRIWYVKIGIVLVLYISQQEKCMFVLWSEYIVYVCHKSRRHKRSYEIKQ